MPDFSEEIYVDPRTDFGFKHLFGSKDNKDFLISFINSLLRGKHHVEDLEYLPTENLGMTQEARNSIFDVYCKGEHGEHFIVEMQNSFQPTFKSRSIYYATFPIQEGVKRGVKNYGFPPVYTICLLNFTFDAHEESTGNDSYLTEVKLMDVDTKEVFFNDLTFIYVEIPKFIKTVQELDSDLDRWVYLLRNLARLSHMPAPLQTKLFTRFFEQARIRRLTYEQARQYRTDAMSMISFNEMLDWKEQVGLEKGREEGREEGIMMAKLEMAKSLLAKGLTPEEVASITGLSQAELKGIR